jgi:hypothetical protein
MARSTLKIIPKAPPKTARIDFSINGIPHYVLHGKAVLQEDSLDK